MSFIPRRVGGFLRRRSDAAIRVGVLLVTAAVCVPLMAIVPDARPYGATFLAWTLAFALRLWRWLPSERAHVRRAAHRLADARMRQRGVGKVLLPYTGTSRTSTATRTTTAGSAMPLVPRQSRECLRTGDARLVEEAAVRAAAAAAAASASDVSAQRRPFVRTDGDSRSAVAAPRRPTITDLGDGTVARRTAFASAEPPVDTGLSTSALVSSVEFLARTRASAPAVEPLALALFHARGTGAATPSENASDAQDGGRDTATDVPRHGYEPFTHASRAADSATRSAASGSSSAVFSSVGSAASPTSPASGGTQGYSGVADAAVSVPPTPHADPPHVQQRQWGGAVPLSRHVHPAEADVDEPPAAMCAPREAAAWPDELYRPAPRIAITSSTLRLQRLAPPVPRRDPHPR